MIAQGQGHSPATDDGMVTALLMVRNGANAGELSDRFSALCTAVAHPTSTAGLLGRLDLTRYRIRGRQLQLRRFDAAALALDVATSFNPLSSWSPKSAHCECTGTTAGASGQSHT